MEKEPNHNLDESENPPPEDERIANKLEDVVEQKAPELAVKSDVEKNEGSKAENPEGREAHIKALRERIDSASDTAFELRRQAFQRGQSRLQELKQRVAEEREEQSKSNWQVLTELWQSEQNASRLTLIGEFLLNPNALRQRHRAEKDFQKNLESHWHKPRKKTEDE